MNMVLIQLRRFPLARSLPFSCCNCSSKDICKKPSKSLKSCLKLCPYYEKCVLPKMPLPPLEQTLKKYEKSMMPLLSEKCRLRLRKLISEFGAPEGPGPRLQAYLEIKRRNEDHWGYYYWLDDMHFLVRKPLPINQNPAVIFPPQKFTSTLDIARFAARLLDAALMYKATLDRREIPIGKCATSTPGVFNCTKQFYHILGTSRLPGKIRDCHYKPELPLESRREHVIVICRRKFYLVQLIAPDIGRLNEDEICSQLLFIIDDAPRLTETIPVGILTALPRSHWYEARKSLSEDDINRQNLHLITTSLMVLCLDQSVNTSFNSRVPRGVTGYALGGRDETNMLHQMLHGGGIHYNSANRWFDKTIQLIISCDGACGLCYEQTAAEPYVILDLVKDLLRHADSMPLGSECPNICRCLPGPMRLEWRVASDVQSRIKYAAKCLESDAKDLDFQVYRFGGYGDEFMKSCKVSPEVYCQLALQLAIYKLCGMLVATNERVETRRFRHGRVGYIRSASVEALNWARAMVGPKKSGQENTCDSVSDEAKLQLWCSAVKQQTEEMNDNISGQGIDLHLLGLREAARETSDCLPEFFTDTTFQIANKFILSTSQISNKGEYFMGYGPAEPDGYSTSYTPKKDQILFCVSSFLSSEYTNTCAFVQSLEESLCAMQTFWKKF